MKKLTAIFPGTFDPITLGHIDLIKRASALFSHLIVAVANSPNKRTLFSLEERVGLAKKSVSEFSNVTVLGYSSLMAHFAAEHQCSILIRGVRNSLDFEYEKQLYEMNLHLKSDLDSLFLVPHPSVAFISSSLVKEVAIHNGEIDTLVSSDVKEALLSKIATPK